MTEPKNLAATLFACTFAAQSAYLVLTAVLPDVATAFNVSTATAGQIRTLAAVVALAAALWAATAGRRVPRRTLLRAALGLDVAGAALSASAPSLLGLACGQCLIGAASAIVVASGVAAAAEWSDQASRARVLAWTIIGAPSSWILTMPVIGVFAAIEWRLAFAVPVLTAMVAAAMLRQVPRGAPPQAERAETPPGAGLRRFAAGELLFNSGWGGTLLYVGALLVDSYGTSPAALGLALAIGAAAYLPGTFLAKSFRPETAPALLAAIGLVLAAAALAFGTLRAGVAASTALFAVICFLAGARQYLGSAVGLDLAADRNVVMALRSAAAQAGWIAGAAAGGAALAAGGYPGLAAVLAVLFAASALPYRGAFTWRLRAPAIRPSARRLAAARAPEC